MRDLSITTWRLLSAGRSCQPTAGAPVKRDGEAGVRMSSTSSGARNNRPPSAVVPRGGPDAEGRPLAATIGEEPLLKAGVQLARAQRHRNAGVSRVSLVQRWNLHLFLAGEWTGEGGRGVGFGVGGRGCIDSIGVRRSNFDSNITRRKNEMERIYPKKGGVGGRG